MAMILTFAFAFGSAMYAFNNKYILIAVVLLFYIIVQKIFQWRHRYKLLHQTSIQYHGKKINVKALLDSGNSLIDPVSKMPVSIISGDSSKETIDRAFTYQIVDMISKPFNDTDIKRVVERTMFYKEMN